ncbi:MAG: hypothetical protein M1812_006677 [Candelaria pacifica]|nr:MAG: hypothetical protein M1812_006677 [Candelaria pacifica]
MVRTNEKARGSMTHPNICCCYYTYATEGIRHGTKNYLPQVKLSAHTTILSTVSRTRLNQIFVNASLNTIKEAIYTFPLYDGVSVVAFTCRIGNRVIKGIVKERQKAKEVFRSAADRGETAGLLEQLPEASDVFTSTIANIPAGEEVHVTIEYLGELKHDAEVDGIRFTLPTAIAPRYGELPGNVLGHQGTSTNVKEEGGIEVTVDATITEGTFIRGIQSPSHPIAVSMGTTSAAPNDDPQMNRASATLTLGSAKLEKDFVLLVLAKESSSPTAVLETHPTIPGQRALMATLVPKFSLKNIHPEIVFVADRSGSMTTNVTTLVSALMVFLKSLPVGVRFNICSFGSQHSFLWPKSKAYDADSLQDAIDHVQTFDASYGGTEMLQPIKETIKRRYKDLALEIILLTDGEIWAQEQLLSYINKEVGGTEAPIRCFTLGVGNSVSHALVEGIARAGNGFAQVVGEEEKLEHKVVRSLKGALSPHINDYSLEVRYGQEETNEEDEIERVTDSLHVMMRDPSPKFEEDTEPQKPISLFDVNANTDKEETPPPDQSGQSRYIHLQPLHSPKLLQVPHRIPPLFPFIRSTVYLLLSPRASRKTPKSVILKATSPQGPLELEMNVQILSEAGEMIHQLAAKKAVGELEEGRGWIFDAKDDGGVPIKERFEGRFDEMVEREAVRLGVEFQVGGKWCSFVAVEQNDDELAEKSRKAKAAADAEKNKESQKMLLDDRDNLLFTADPTASSIERHDAAINEDWEKVSVSSSTISTGTRVSTSTSNSNTTPARFADTRSIPPARGKFGGGSSRGGLLSLTNTSSNTPSSATQAFGGNHFGSTSASQSSPSATSGNMFGPTNTSQSTTSSVSNTSRGGLFGTASAPIVSAPIQNVKYDATTTPALQQQQHQQQEPPPSSAQDISPNRKRVSPFIDVQAEVDESDETSEVLDDFDTYVPIKRAKRAPSAIAAAGRKSPATDDATAPITKMKEAATSPTQESEPQMSIPIESTSDAKTPEVEFFKSLRVDIESPCRDILPVAMQKYNLSGDWRDYNLHIVYKDNQERTLGLDEKPLTIFKQLDREGKKPMFMVNRKQASESEPEQDAEDFIEEDRFMLREVGIAGDADEGFENKIESLGGDQSVSQPEIEKIESVIGINHGTKKSPRRQMASKAASNLTFSSSPQESVSPFYVPEEECEASDDEDMGFGYFVDDPLPPAQAPAPAFAPAPKTDSERLHLLIALQSFEGSWDLEASLCNLINIGIGIAESQLAESLMEEGIERRGGVDEREIRRVWCTVLVVTFLEIRLKAEREAWELVVEKARVWLEGVGVEGGLLEEWMKKAEALLVGLPGGVL